jgi:hypothetical protein
MNAVSACEALDDPDVVVHTQHGFAVLSRKSGRQDKVAGAAEAILLDRWARFGPDDERTLAACLGASNSDRVAGRDTVPSTPP